MDIFVDGACSGNPGKGMAFVLIDKSDDDFIPYKRKLKQYFEEATNNQMEYQGLILALEWIENTAQDILKDGIKQIVIHTDSKLISGHINDGWKINKNTALVLRAKKLIKKIEDNNIKIIIKWIPREQNIAGIMIENGEV